MTGCNGPETFRGDSGGPEDNGCRCGSPRPLHVLEVVTSPGTENDNLNILLNTKRDVLSVQGPLTLELFQLVL